MYKPFKLSPVKNNYFGTDNKNTLCYLSCSQSEILEEMNSFFVKKYNYANVAENQYSYIPHISLFTILDSSAYAPHKKAIDQLIKCFITIRCYQSKDMV